MLKKPLHHCYLISADQTDKCSESVISDLKKIFADSEKELIIDADTTDTLTVDMARRLSERGQQKAVGQARCIIRGFNTATTEAQNALLKIIESPAEGTHFFLLTPQPDNLLETVRSRVWKLEGFCSADEVDATIMGLADDFLKSDTLPGRLKVVGGLDSRHQLRRLVSELAESDLARENIRFGEALEKVADWSQDAGGSVKLLGQYIAVAAGDSPQEN